MWRVVRCGGGVWWCGLVICVEWIVEGQKTTQGGHELWVCLERFTANICDAFDFGVSTASVRDASEIRYVWCFWEVSVIESVS